MTVLATAAMPRVDLNGLLFNGDDTLRVHTLDGWWDTSGHEQQSVRSQQGGATPVGPALSKERFVTVAGHTLSGDPMQWRRDLLAAFPIDTDVPLTVTYADGSVERMWTRPFDKLDLAPKGHQLRFSLPLVAYDPLRYDPTPLTGVMGVWTGSRAVLNFDPVSMGLRFKTDQVAPLLRNVVANPSFEAGVADWALTGLTLSTDTSWAAAGSQSALVTITDDVGTSYAYAQGSNPSNRHPCAPGDYISARIAVRAVRDCQVNITTQFYEDASGVGVGGGGATDSVPLVAGEETVLHLMDVQATDPVTNGAITLVRFNDPDGSRPSLGDVAQIDAHRIVNHGQVPSGLASLPYGDGDSAGWQWDGTPHASQSRRAAMFDAVMHFRPLDTGSAYPDAVLAHSAGDGVGFRNVFTVQGPLTRGDWWLQRDEDGSRMWADVSLAAGQTGVFDCHTGRVMVGGVDVGLFGQPLALHPGANTFRLVSSVQQAGFASVSALQAYQ